MISFFAVVFFDFEFIDSAAMQSSHRIMYKLQVHVLSDLILLPHIKSCQFFLNVMISEQRKTVIKTDTKVDSSIDNVLAKMNKKKM